MPWDWYLLTAKQCTMEMGLIGMYNKQKIEKFKTRGLYLLQ